MIDKINPGLVLILGALLIPFLSDRLRAVYVLLLPPIASPEEA